MKQPAKEQGQTVVVVAFAIIALLAFAGLAIDGGTAYLNRRRMQNAADAAALAGTHRLAEIICNHSAGNDAAIQAEVIDYALRNGVDDASGVVATYVKFENNTLAHYNPEVYVGSGYIPVGATGIAVTTTITRPTYFLNLIGQSTGAATASATAVTGPLLVSGGLRPIGLPVEVIQDLGPGDNFTVNMENNCDEDNCTVRYIRRDGRNVTHAHRGWLNLHYVWNQGEAPQGFPRAIDPNIGTGWGGPQHAGLMDWMLNPPNIVLYADCPWNQTCGFGDYIAAKPGLDWGALTGGGNPSLCEQISNEISILPIFDAVPRCETEIPDPKPPCSHQGGQSVGYAYHIVGFSAVYITGCDQGAGGVHNIHMEMRQTILGSGQVSTSLAEGFDPNGEGGCRYNLQVVTLWR